MSHIKEVLITAGGTRESIDDVRFVGNFSAGSFGVNIANAFARELTSTEALPNPELEDTHITLLAPKETHERFDVDKRIDCRTFTDAASLGKLLLEHETRPDVIIHAAAVADYTPTRLHGKLSSDADELTITMQRTPKLLAKLRKTYGPRSFLTGFKLLSDVSTNELTAVGMRQLFENNLDLTVANDLKDIRPLGRKVIALSKGELVKPIEGSTQDVAAQLASLIIDLSSKKEIERINAIIPESI